jgi:hypothetical protein
LPNVSVFQPSVQMPQTASRPISMLGVRTRVVPPVVQLVSQPVTFAPPKNDGSVVEKVARQPSMDLDAEGGISAQSSGLEWKNQLGSSDSAVFFGISPMNSFKFR